jgi:hypothetical protein
VEERAASRAVREEAFPERAVERLLDHHVEQSQQIVEVLDQAVHGRVACCPRR